MLFNKHCKKTLLKVVLIIVLCAFNGPETEKFPCFVEAVPGKKHHEILFSDFKINTVDESYIQ